MQITEYSINYPGTQPMSLALLCDLHNNPSGDLFDTVTQVNPSVVLFAGDFVENALDYTKSFELISELAARYPVFCSIGNHERLFSDNLSVLMKETRATLLDNQYVQFGGMYIGGLTSGTTYSPSFLYNAPVTDWLRPFSELNGYKILLCHHPEYYDTYIKNLPIDLVLSGHAHGGQVRVFGRGLFAPGQGVLPKYTSGIHDKRLIISRGLTNTARRIPRLWNKPEVVVVNLIPFLKKN